MWQIEWMLNLLPDWVFHFLLLAGFLGIVASYILKRIPFINQYFVPVRIVSVLVVFAMLWLCGGRSNQHMWEAKVKEMEDKVAAAEAASSEVNKTIETKIVTKTKIIKEKGDAIIQYVDKVVTQDKEVIKFVENCPIPTIIVNTINAAAKNQPIEEKK